MTIVLSSETEQLIEERLKNGRFPSADAVVRAALETLQQVESDELDDESLAAIEEGLAEANRGEGSPWEQVREQLKSKYLSK
jgi:putative addiction module CopG family antidote